jgi:hypothetical protein
MIPRAAGFFFSIGGDTRRNRVRFDLWGSTLKERQPVRPASPGRHSRPRTLTPVGGRL